jgi:hypothetical protein
VRAAFVRLAVGGQVRSRDTGKLIDAPGVFLELSDESARRLWVLQDERQRRGQRQIELL